MRTGSPSTAEPNAGGVPEPVLAAIETHLRDRERRREELYHQARRTRRLATATIAKLHRGLASTEDVAAVRHALAELTATVRGDSRADEPVALDAFQESVEACLLGAIVHGSPWPTPGDLGVDPEAYLLGLGDVIGEVRRLLLDRLGHEDLPAAETHLARMEHLTEALLRFDTSRAIVQLKPKQDQARILLERSRGEVVMARFLLHARPAAGGSSRC